MEKITSGLEEQNLFPDWEIGDQGFGIVGQTFDLHIT
jgi:hypothetical protein